MKPEIHKIPLGQYSLGEQKLLCKCKEKCNFVLTILRKEDYVQLCEKQAAHYALSILEKLDIVVGAERDWTKFQEDTMIDYINRRGIHYGCFEEIAKLVGKTKMQVKSKARRLQSKGIIPKLDINPAYARRGGRSQ